jgi:hypothetical protein
MTKPSSLKKWSISLWSVLTVFIVFNPVTYFITNSIFSMVGLHTIKKSNGVLGFSTPTIFGFVLHLFVFMFLVRLMMDIKLPGLS